LIAVLCFSIPGEVTTWLISSTVTIFGSLVTVYLVDKFYRDREREEQDRVRQVALREFQTSLNGHLSLLVQWYVASRDQPPDTVPVSYANLLDDEFIETVKHMDFSK